MLNGIDISNYQAGIPQSVIAQADVIVCKATEGTGYQDPHLFDNFSKAANAGKKVGAYHFWRPGAPGAAQASYFINYLKANQLTVDFAVLDFEDESDLANESGALEFMQIVEQKLGVKCWFYCYVNPLKTYGYWQIRKKHKFWLAGYYLGYQQVQGFTPPMSLDEYIVFNGIDSSGIDFAGWQYSPVGRLNGYAGDLDLNMFYEDAFTTPATQNVSASSQTITLMPVTGFTVSQNFGDGKDLSSNTGVGHSGMDFATPVGTPAISLEAGTVLWADWAQNLPSTSWADRWFIGSRGFAGLPIDAGICIVIQHGTWISTYSHMNKTDLSPGDKVVQGQVVGETGYTGYTYNSVTGFAYEEPHGAHLHFEALVDTTNYYTTNDGSMIYGRVDPRPYFTQTVENPVLAKANAAIDSVIDLLGLDMTNDEFRQIIREEVGDKLTGILNELTPGKAGVKNAGNVFIMLYNIAGHLEEFKNLFMPGKAGVRYEGGMRALIRSFVEGKK